MYISDSFALVYTHTPIMILSLANICPFTIYIDTQSTKVWRIQYIRDSKIRSAPVYL